MAFDKLRLSGSGGEFYARQRRQLPPPRTHPSPIAGEGRATAYRLAVSSRISGASFCQLMNSEWPLPDMVSPDW